MNVNFSISSLESVTAALKKSAEDLHLSAIQQYPSEKYQTEDTQSVDLWRAYLFLSNILDGKYLEMGINVLDRDLKYLSTRTIELENFYNIATGTDADDIASSVAQLHKEILILKKKYKNSLNTEFTVDIDDSIADHLNGIY